MRRADLQSSGEKQQLHGLREDAEQLRGGVGAPQADQQCGELCGEVREQLLWRGWPGHVVQDDAHKGKELVHERQVHGAGEAWRAAS